MAAALHRVADRALTVLAVLGVVVLLGAVLGTALGVRPLLFRSGSMAPAIDTGALALAREVPAVDLRTGDVVSVLTASGARVTHRVVATRPVGDEVRLTLRGDGNQVDDPEQYVVGSAYRVFWHAPLLGYAVAAVASPGGLVGLGVLLATLLLLVGRNGRRSPPGGRRRAARRRPRRHRPVVAGASAAAMLAVVAGPGLTGIAVAAAWSDPVPVSATTLTAAVLGTPTTSCGGGGLLSSPTISWPVPAGPAPASYLVTYSDGITVHTASVTGTTWKLPSNLLNLLTTYTIRVQSVLGPWQSPVSNAQQISVTNILFIGVVAACV